MSHQPVELDQLLSAVKPLILQYLQENYEDDTPVCVAKSPEELRGLVDLALNDHGVGPQGILELIQQTLMYSTRTGHPCFFDKLYVGSEPIGIIAEMLTTVLNSNIHIFRVSPVFSLMEIQVVKEMSKIFGYPDGDGLTCPGGAFSNMLALLCARNTLFPHTKLEGVAKEDQLVVLTSGESHYSISKSANALGLGLNNVIKVPTDRNGEMIPGELERMIVELKAAGRRPFFVNATAGTTVTGGFDPIEEIAAIAKKHGLWCHVDACWGGSVIFSKKHQHLMRGSGLSDSLSWNPHKMLGVPLQMSLLLVKEKGLLGKSNALGATYLFRGGEFDLGDKTLQCGRRPDILKLFLTWKYHGSQGFEKRINTAFENTQKFVELLKKRSSEFELAMEPKGLNICFWYNPGWIRSVEPGDMRDRVYTQVTTRVGNLVNSRARVLVDFSPNHHGPEFFRMVINNPFIREKDLGGVLNEIELAGKACLEDLRLEVAGAL